MNDLRYAFRSLAKSPVFATVAVVSLAIGIGANTAVFSIVKAILLRSLPVPHPQELRLVHWTGLNASISNFTGSFEQRDVRAQAGAFSYPAYCDMRDRAQGLAEVFAWFPLYNLATRICDDVGVSTGTMVSGNFFQGYGAHARIGRAITPDDDRAGAEPVVVITDRFWERRFARDPGAVGQTLHLNRHPFTIVGVLRKDYAGPMMGDPADVYVPLASQPTLEPYRSLTSYDNWWVLPMARVARGTSDAQLQAALSAVFVQGLEQGKSRLDEPHILLPSGGGGVINARRAVVPTLFGLQAIVGVVLAIACANLAGLSVARALARRREFAVCAALGASRGRLIRRMLTESLVLASGGAALGLVFALWIRDGLLRSLPHDQLDMHFDAGIDPRVLSFTGLVAIGTALLCGVLPAWRAARADLVHDLQGGRIGSFTRQRLGRGLVVTQVALFIVLVAATGLFVRSIGNLREVDPGFDPDNLLLFGLHADRAAYSDRQRDVFFDEVRSAIGRIPGVRGVALADVTLISGSVATNSFSIPGRGCRPEERWHAHVMTVGEDYFATMRIPLLRGREFDLSDQAESTPVAVINERFAGEHFSEEDPVGQIVRMGGTDFQIIGVSRSTLYDGVKRAKPSTITFSARQRPRETLYVTVRTTVPPLSLVPAARRAVASIDPFVPLSGITTQGELFVRSLFFERMFATFCGSLGGLAVLLSCIGVYGLLAYNVTRRTAEIGVRMALGALPAVVARGIVRDAIVLILWGVMAGLPLAIGIGVAARGIFFGVTPYDPLAMGVATLGLLLVALLAAWLPAQRAAHIDPLIALRAE